MGCGSNHKLMHERNTSVKDHFTGSHLKDLSLSQDEFDILVEMERYYPCLDSESARHALGVERDEAFHFLRGLNCALNIVLETNDGFKCQLNWQSVLY